MIIYQRSIKYDNCALYNNNNIIVMLRVVLYFVFTDPKNNFLSYNTIIAQYKLINVDILQAHYNL